MWCDDDFVIFLICQCQYLRFLMSVHVGGSRARSNLDPQTLNVILQEDLELARRVQQQMEMQDQEMARQQRAQAQALAQQQQEEAQKRMQKQQQMVSQQKQSQEDARRMREEEEAMQVSSDAADCTRMNMYPIYIYRLYIIC